MNASLATQKAVLDKIAASSVGEVTLEPDWLSELVDVLSEDSVCIDPVP